MPKRSPLRLFVLVDALGWTYLRDRQILADVLPCRSALRTVLGFSSGAIPSILTGVPPAEHGQWNLLYYDPQSSPFRWLRHVHFLPNALLETRLARKLLKELGRRVLGLGPLFECAVPAKILHYFNWSEKRNIYATGGLEQRATIFDELADQGVRTRIYSYHHGSDDTLLAAACKDLREDAADFYFVYLSELDHFLHHHCTEKTAVEERLLHYERQIRGLIDSALAQDPAAQIAVFSDHGMTPIRDHFNLVTKIAALGLKSPGQYLAVYDSTMARFWFFSEEARCKTIALLNDLPLGRVLSTSELKELGLLFSDNRYGDVIFLMQPGVVIADSHFESRWAPTGMHGFDPSDPYSDAIFLSNVRPSQPMHSITDLHHFMLHPEGGND